MSIKVGQTTKCIEVVISFKNNSTRLAISGVIMHGIVHLTFPIVHVAQILPPMMYNVHHSRGTSLHNHNVHIPNELTYRN